MSDISCLLVITKREDEEKYVEFYKQHNIGTCIQTYAYASSIDKSLNYLGVEDVSRILHCAIVKKGKCEELLQSLVEDMGLAVPGNGLAFILPVRTISGETSMKYLTRGQKVTDNNKNEEKEMSENTKEITHVLVTVVIEKGFSEMVADVLKEIGLNKITIIRARTVAKNDVSEEFLGMALADEKEVIHVVVEKKDEEKVIEAIMKNAGMDTEAHGAAFSMPINKIVGF